MKKYVIYTETNRVVGLFNSEHEAGSYIYKTYILDYWLTEEILDMLPNQNEYYPNHELWKYIDCGAIVIELEEIDKKGW